MKIVFSVLVWTLLILLLLAPLGAGVTAIFGYSFVLGNYWAFAVAEITITAILALLSLVTKETVEDKISQILFAVITPCALVNTMFYISQCGMTWLVVSLLICVGCGFLTIRHGRPLPVRAGALVSTAALVLPVCLICVLLVAIGNAQTNEVVWREDSPSGNRYAEVISIDQGEYENDTVVKVYDKKGFDAGIFKVTKKPLKVYVGEGTQGLVLQIQWKDDNCLIINSGEYKFN